MRVKSANTAPPPRTAQALADELARSPARGEKAFRRLVCKGERPIPGFETGGAAVVMAGSRLVPSIAEVSSRAATLRMVDRLLIRGDLQAGEARIRIASGPLAGTEIRVTAKAGVVEARLLTQPEHSRQTLAVAMDEIIRRLRRRGIAMRPMTSRADTRHAEDASRGGDRP